ncbi:MAG: sulfate adenylyltransferase [Pseudomonadales bacterium]|nr:sulfate adenylyltransferase [Pseudomonadales bacterium]
MIKPLGSDTLLPLYIEDAAENAAVTEKAQGLKQVLVSSAAAANAVMMGGGYFTPLQGFMTLADAKSVASDLKTADGTFFPVPVLNMLPNADDLSIGQEIALLDPNVDGNPVIAVQRITSIDEASEQELASIAEEIFGTLDKDHPGVATFLSQGNFIVAGPIQVLNFSYFAGDFPDTFRTAVSIRAEIESRGWDKVVAFQTRNPMHRAHEELCRMAMNDLGTDGILIHMLLGKLKKGDIPADVRDTCIRTMVDNYFPENTVMITGYGFDMLYAGPREAVLHAYFRQNCGCTHFIVGRDHAGVGDYYGAFDAQTIFDQRVPEGSLAIEIYKADHTAYSKKLDRVVMMKDAPDHAKEDFVLLSGTKVREMLGNGIAPPPEFSRPEVAQVLMDYYKLEA